MLTSEKGTTMPETVLYSGKAEIDRVDRRVTLPSTSLGDRPVILTVLVVRPDT